jgi:hypothetical protein
MVLYVIGLGLYDEKDITVRQGRACTRAVCCPRTRAPNSLLCRGLEAVKRCSRVYLEAYTSVLMVPKERLVPARRWRRLALHVCAQPCQTCTAVPSRAATSPARSSCAQAPTLPDRKRPDWQVPG